MSEAWFIVLPIAVLLLAILGAWRANYRVRNREVIALRDCVRVFGLLYDSEKQRVIRYLIDKFGLSGRM